LDSALGLLSVRAAGTGRRLQEAARKMKVLHLIETLQVGGAEQSLLEILSRLRSSEAVMCHIYEGSEMRSAYEAAGVSVVSLDIPPKYNFLKAVRRVEDLVRRERPDLIHTTLFRAEVVGRVVGWRMGLPVVCSFVSDCYADIRWRTLSPAGRFKLKGVQLVDRWTAGMATHFVANSRAVAEAQARALKVPLDRVTVIHRGRDPSRFTASLDPEWEREYRGALGIPDGAPVVLSVGRLVDSKGQAELIEAFERVAAAVPDAALLIAGDGPERANLEDLARSRGIAERVRLLGTRSDIPELLALASVFAFPSHYEGHPGAVVEAMFAGRAIVLADNPVHRETIEHGRTGIIVPVHRPEELAAGITALLLEPRRAAELGTHARNEGLQRFDIAQAAAEHDALYDWIVAEHTASRKGRRAPETSEMLKSDDTSRRPAASI
jgi:glycosyltransferase involved in cell wall biosynthesis